MAMNVLVLDAAEPSIARLMSQFHDVFHETQRTLPVRVASSAEDAGAAIAAARPAVLSASRRYRAALAQVINSIDDECDRCHCACVAVSVCVARAAPSAPLGLNRHAVVTVPAADPLTPPRVCCARGHVVVCTGCV
jgi:hypothetical protein